MPAKISLLHGIIFLKIFFWVIGEPRRKGTSWRGWRKRRDRLTRDHRAFGWTRSDGPSGEYRGVQYSVNSAFYTHTHTHTHTHVWIIHTHSWPPVHLVFESVELWLEWGTNQALIISLPNIQGKKILFPFVTQAIELLNFFSHFEI